eukprot:m.311320 g.311320  ORF g.311320 m.311320 type:complete len:346 (+) comp65104_c0_seq1:91-1128(+)
MVSNRLRTLSETPVEYREAFINTGYRCKGLTAKECIQTTMFHWTNETTNVWTHFLPLAVFIAWAVYINRYQFDLLKDPYAHPLLVFIVGSAILTSCSSFAHLFNCMSFRARHVCFYIDYLGITMYGLMTGVAYWYYSAPFDTVPFYSDPFRLQCGSVLLGIVSFYLACLTRHQWLNVRYIIRTMVFALPYFYDSFPIFLRIYLAREWEPSLPYHVVHMSLIAGGSIVNAMKIPERFWPGAFDCIGTSHHVMHLCSSLACFTQIVALTIDMDLRQVDIRRRPPPSLFEVVGPSLFLLACGIAILILFSQRLNQWRNPLEKKASVGPQTDGRQRRPSWQKHVNFSTK